MHSPPSRFGGSISRTLSMHKLSSSPSSSHTPSLDLKSHQQNGIQWTMAMRTLSAFDHAFNLLKLQLKLEKNSEIISLFFLCFVLLPPRHRGDMCRRLSSLFLFNIFNSRNVISFAFFRFFSPLLLFVVVFSRPCMILIQFIAYLKTHKN